MQSKKKTIESHFRQEMNDRSVRVEKAEHWYTRVAERLPPVSLKQASAEATASTGVRPVRVAVKETGDGTVRVVTHFKEAPPRFMLFGRWARPVVQGDKSTRSDPRQRERVAQ